ncbi:MAG: type II toxin-antitoxin system VapC family toxin [Methanobrevibacter ruminantium]|uniref:type II toxin-antitoxin system VapC family toxin n=1 Tax=Methanobrevibacter ruminantium TaxID=83816 RepID=UPI0026EEC0B4|nr:type II toxin-antitoxin system VapC family toxin [Methanobrevibacter ruminantium]MDD6049107.1 type II toxin-antitoxin system VapC family toxin [Methanobrevibacter ruminantium]
MIFLDSTYLIGLILKNDSLYYKSHLLKPYLGDENKIINNTVFNEVLNSVTSNNSHYDLNHIKKLLLSFNIDFLTSDDYLDSFDIFEYYNFSVNFSDCTILNTMQNYNINQIASFDSDFDKIKGVKRIYLK